MSTSRRLGSGFFDLFENMCLINDVSCAMTLNINILYIKSTLLDIVRFRNLAEIPEVYDCLHD